MHTRSLFRPVAVVALLALASCGGEKIGDRPPEFVGAWTAVRRGALWRVELRENGRFRAKPDDPMAGATKEGEWGVDGDKMLWSYTDSESRIKTVLAGVDEENEILKVDKDTFELIERDGSRTRYTRAKPPPPAAPKPAEPAELPNFGAPTTPPPSDSTESIEPPLE